MPKDKRDKLLAAAGAVPVVLPKVKPGEWGDAPAARGKPWKPDKPAILQGIIVSVRQITTKFGPTRVVDVRDAKGQTWSVFAKGPMEAMLQPIVETYGLGVEVRIRFVEWVKLSKGRKVRNFTVQFRAPKG